MCLINCSEFSACVCVCSCVALCLFVYVRGTRPIVVMLSSEVPCLLYRWPLWERVCVSFCRVLGGVSQRA